MDYIDRMIAGDFDTEIAGILEEKAAYEAAYAKKIPVFLAGGIWNYEDVLRAKALGVDGVQVATRFVTTEECDASLAYKMAYVNATANDVTIIKSPVGLPGRALNNQMIRSLKGGNQKITRCYHCIKNCKPAEIPYCITNALINAVNGNIDEGLIFCGANVDRITKIETVHDVVTDLMFVN